jgi:hypothetical protein
VESALRGVPSSERCRCGEELLEEVATEAKKKPALSLVPPTTGAVTSALDETDVVAVIEKALKPR